MAFCKNISQQMNVFDSYLRLTDRERKLLNNTWAEKFSNEIFPLINEERFSGIYSDNPATRPNNPVNVYFGLLMLREIFSQSDVEAIESLMFDVRYQYALHTSSFSEQPVSKNSLSNFRTAVYRYNEVHNVDLIQEEIESHAKAFAKLLKIDDRIMRMDSLMISSSCKKLSRLEIMYSCVSRLIKDINESEPSLLPGKFVPYLEEGHRNDTIYRCRDKDIQSKYDTVVADAVELYNLCKGTALEAGEDFQNLARMLGDQTRATGNKTELKPGKEISPESLQNPTDPDATYRKKGSKEHIGYVANVAERFDGANSIITHYDMKQNTYSDKAFADDIIEKLGQQEAPTKVLVDGAYYSGEISVKAAKNNLEFIPTDLVGRPVSEGNSGFDKFDIDESAHVVKRCPMGYAPEDSRYKDGFYSAHFTKEHCVNCPQRAACPVIKQKKKYIFRISEKKLHCALLRIKMGTAEYQETARKRAGVEGIPSTLRRRYNIDNMPVRGRIRSKVWLGFMISAINCKRYMKSRIETTKEALSSYISIHLSEIFCFQRASATIRVAL